MEKQPYDDLQSLIADEKKAVIQQMFFDLWEEAYEQGIEAEVVAEILVEGSIRELVAKNGEDESSRILTDLGKLEEQGAFLPRITLQWSISGILENLLRFQQVEGLKFPSNNLFPQVFRYE